MPRTLKRSELPQALPDDTILIVVSRLLRTATLVKQARTVNGVCDALAKLLSNGNSEKRKVQLKSQRFRICTASSDPEAPIDTMHYDRSVDINKWFSPDYETLIIMTEAAYARSGAEEAFRYRRHLAFSGAITYLTTQCGLNPQIYTWPQPGSRELVSHFPRA